MTTGSTSTNPQPTDHNIHTDSFASSDSDNSISNSSTLSDLTSITRDGIKSIRKRSSGLGATASVDIDDDSLAEGKIGFLN